MSGEMCDIVCAHLETPTKQSQLGAKGVGEAGTAGAPAAVMNAITTRSRRSAPASPRCLSRRTDLESTGQGVKNPRVSSAISHWAPRFVSNGVLLADFEEVTASLERWEDWCAAWSRRARLHEDLGS